ncbi:MAG TPA: serine/threonine-protein kinase, partial [Myxococcota bacterium]|nr:serine/threonine-protein kinase [Myxococcota bacterium]
MQAPLGLPSGSIVADRYELTGELGRGERSIVYCARDRRTGADVALKLLALSPATAHFARQRLRREAEIVRTLAHPGIVRPLELVDHGSWSLIAMELVSGRSLAAAVAADGPMHPDAVARLGIEIAEALSAAHRCGVVHHDLKPENVLLDAGGRAHLADFGCARLEGQALLTLPEDPVTLAAYLPPEVVEGQIADPRSDVYSLGLVLYFALVGSVPKGQRPNLPPPPLAGGYHPRERRPEVPEWLDEIVARATRAEPGHRLETAERLGRALSQRSLESRGDDTADGRALRVCVLCRRPGTLGRAVCPHCEDLDDAAADHLVLVVPAHGREARDNQLRLLSELTSIPPRQLALRSAARAQRALVRVSAAHAEVLVKRLRGRGIEARALHVDRAWTVLPYWSLGLAGVTLLAGAGAAWAGFPLLLLAS